MASPRELRPWAFRVEGIPEGTTMQQLREYFHPDDRSDIQIKSIAPAVDNYDHHGELTATISFSAVNSRVTAPRILDDTISIDDSFHNLTPLNQPEEPIVADIIAVTGLAGHAFGSWAQSAQTMWLRDLVPRDIRNVRVLIYGYESKLEGNMSRSILSDYSNNFIRRLSAMRTSANCEHRPLILVGHSLGCLIIKRALNEVNGSNFHHAYLPVRSIIFFGAPHRGLETAALETLVKSQPSEDLIRELRPESPTLTDLSERFRHVAKDIDILSCYEQRPTKTAIQMADGKWKREGKPQMMVPLDSARLYHHKEEIIACQADHSQIAKLRRGENSIYWAIKANLLKAVGNEAKDEPSMHQVSSRSFNNELNMSTSESNNGQARGSEGKGNGTKEELPFVTFQKSNRHNTLQSESPQPGIPGGRSNSEGLLSNEKRASQSMNVDSTIGSNSGSSVSAVDQVHNKKPMRQDGTETPHRGASTLSRLSQSYSSESIIPKSKSAYPGDQDRNIDQCTSGIWTSPVKSRVDQQEQSSLAANEPLSTRNDVKVPPIPPKIKDDSIASKTYMLKPDIKPKESKLYTLPSPDSAEPEKATLPAVSSDEEEKAFVQLPSKGKVALTALAQSSPNSPSLPLSGKKDEQSESPTPIPPDPSLQKELCIAVKQGDVQTIESLLGRGGKVHTSPATSVDQNQDPFLLAALYRQEDVLKIFLKHSPNPAKCTLERRHNALHLLGDTSEAVARTVTESIVVLLLRLGVDRHAQSADGETPLIMTVRKGDYSFARILLDHGAYVKAYDDGGATALHIATSKKSLELVAMLISKGAPLEAQTLKHKYTPLMYSALKQFASGECARLLLQAGADTEALSGSFLTALQLASMAGSANVIEELMAFGAEIKPRHIDSYDALTIAVRNSHPLAVEALLRHGAQPSVRTWSVFHSEKDKAKKAEILRLLEAHGWKKPNKFVAFFNSI